MYHEIIVSYLSFARLRGFQKAHIWACPPMRGNSFIFWAHPSNQRTPNRVRLAKWYQEMIARAVEVGCVTKVASLYDVSLKISRELPANELPPCPPILDGDFWMDESVRLHSIAAKKAKKAINGTIMRITLPSSAYAAKNGSNKNSERSKLNDCINMFESKIMKHSSAYPFLEPVDVEALKLTNYNDIIRFPMDFGTIMENLQGNKYAYIKDWISDTRLVFKNACLYNPVGHPVHSMSVSLGKAFEREVLTLFRRWQNTRLVDTPAQQQGEDVLGVDFMNVTLKDKDEEEKEKEKEKEREKERTHAANKKKGKKGGKKFANAGSATPTTSSEEPPKDPPSVHNNFYRIIDPVAINAISNSPLDPPCNPSDIIQSNLYAIDTDDYPKKKKETLTLTQGGSAAVAQAMLGEDDTVFDKRGKKVKKKANQSYNRGGVIEAVENKVVFAARVSQQQAASSLEKRASWLGEEVSRNVQKMRNEFFVCDLQKQSRLNEEDKSKVKAFEQYVNDVYNNRVEEMGDGDGGGGGSGSGGGGGEINVAKTDFVALDRNCKTICRFNPLVDARHTLLEMSQYKHFQFDTLRRAKQSSSQILYHLHNPSSAMLKPICSNCKQPINTVRWHAHKTGIDLELCGDCMDRQHNTDNFTPYRVTYNLENDDEEDENIAHDGIEEV